MFIVENNSNQLMNAGQIPMNRRDHVGVALDRGPWHSDRSLKWQVNSLSLSRENTLAKTFQSTPWFTNSCSFKVLPLLYMGTFLSNSLGTVYIIMLVSHSDQGLLLFPSDIEPSTKNYRRPWQLLHCDEVRACDATRSTAAFDVARGACLRGVQLSWSSVVFCFARSSIFSRLFGFMRKRNLLLSSNCRGWCGIVFHVDGH